MASTSRGDGFTKAPMEWKGTDTLWEPVLAFTGKQSTDRLSRHPPHALPPPTSNQQRIKGILNESRSAHTQAVQSRIDSVGEMKDVVGITEQLFALSKVGPRMEIGRGGGKGTRGRMGGRVVGLGRGQSLGGGGVS